MKPSKNLDELCYPFIHETSHLCDFEVATDELCSHVGMILAMTPEDQSDIITDLEQLQPLCFHVNGSIRGRLAVEEKDIAWLLGRYQHYRESLQNPIEGFVLPRGTPPIPQLHLARSAAKKAIRLMVRVEEEGLTVPDILPRICNVMCNFFFVLTSVLNERTGHAPIPFISKSYGSPSSNEGT